MQFDITLEPPVMRAYHKKLGKWHLLFINTMSHWYWGFDTSECYHMAYPSFNARTSSDLVSVDLSNYSLFEGIGDV